MKKIKSKKGNANNRQNRRMSHIVFECMNIVDKLMEMNFKQSRRQLTTPSPTPATPTTCETPPYPTLTRLQPVISIENLNINTLVNKQ
ncbi:MAG: hypothetical protein ACI4TS_02140 [Bacteroidaceae bacterium]